MSPKKKNQYFICPNCGTEVKIGSKACPECGSDEKTGWNDFTYLDGIDLSEDFDYDELLNKEFPNKIKKKVNISWLAIVGIIVLFAFIIGILKYLF